MLTAINNAMVINKKPIYRNLKLVEVLFLGTVFVRMVSVVSIVSSQTINESSVTLDKYLPFSQPHVARFQI